MREWLALVAALELVAADWLPELVDRFGWVGGDLVGREFQVFCPEAEACLGGEFGVACYEVHLGVVEEGVLVEVGGAEGEPGVVDDSDLGVDVDRVGAGTGARVERAGEDAAGVCVCFD